MSFTSPYFNASAPQRFLEGALIRWWRVSAIEREGRLYEIMGLRPVFALVAGLFGEGLPPPTRCDAARVVEALSLNRLRQMLARTRYHELGNLICVLIYLPVLVLTASTRHFWLLAYGMALTSTHLVTVLLERYKRARYESLLRTLGYAVDMPPEGTLSEEATAVPPPALLGAFADRYFRPRAFETERFYARIGLGLFRRFVLWVIRASLPPLPESSRQSRFLAQGREGRAAFEAQTRVAEVTHLVGAALHLPFLVVFLLSRFVPGLLYVAFMLSMNLYCSLLQRSHRARLWRLKMRRSAK